MLKTVLRRAKTTVLMVVGIVKRLLLKQSSGFYSLEGLKTSKQENKALNTFKRNTLSSYFENFIINVVALDAQCMLGAAKHNLGFGGNGPKHHSMAYLIKNAQNAAQHSEIACTPSVPSPASGFMKESWSRDSLMKSCHRVSCFIMQCQTPQPVIMLPGFPDNILG